MSSRRIKQELAEQPSSPTIPNTSSRAQTISSAAATPVAHDTPMEIDTADGANSESQLTMANDTPEAHDGHDALKSLGAHSHRLICGIKKLEELNISATLKSLPKFVVVGDQSAGKSSIVEALCDISLPRSQGTCTRCPFLITTSAQGPFHGGTWSCSISIRSGFYFDSRDSHDSGQFLPRHEPVVAHFATVNNKDDLEPMLRRAQLAVLNPSKDPQMFVGIDFNTTNVSRQVAFSPNVICLEIHGPELPELSFFDLPGSINVIEDDEDPSLVKMIEQLVTSYLKDEKCLVLLACGADQDVETSTTFRFIKSCDATPRCAGVLTKADLVQRGKDRYIQDILGGKKFAFGQGWYITKQLSQTQIDQGVSHAAARDLEADFFRRQAWAGDRCGIPKLQQGVSLALTEHIRGELPDILARVQARLSDVMHQLTMFPERPVHPVFIVMKEIGQVAATITSAVKGDEEVNPFRKSIEGVMQTFKKHLLDVKPSLDYKTPGYKAPSISLDSDDDEPDTPTPARTVPFRPSATPASRKRPAAATPSHRHQRIKPDPAGPSIEKRIYTLDALRDEYEQGNTSGVPGNINGKVTNKLILQALESWTAASDRLLENAAKEVHATAHLAIASNLATRKSTQLYAHSQEILNNFVARLMAEFRSRVAWLCSCEQEKPITFSKWTTAKNQRLREGELARRTQRTNEHFDTRDAATNSKFGTPREKRIEKAKDAAWVQTTLGDDEWAGEIGCAATIFAYYDTASMAFVDSVAKDFEHGVMRPLRLDVEHALLVDLKADDAEVCAQLLAADPEHERQRSALLGERAKLEEALAELRELQV